MNNFDQFWQAYPNRKGKGAASKKYEKIDAETHKIIMLAIDAQKRYRVEAKKTGEFMPEWCMPATWLNQTRWLDEVGSVSELKEKQVHRECAVDGCKAPVHAQRAGPYCYHHYSFDASNRLRTGCVLVPEIRKHYSEHKELHDLRGEAALKFCRAKIRGVLV